MLWLFNDCRLLPVLHRHLLYVFGKFAKSDDNSRFEQIPRSLIPRIPQKYGFDGWFFHTVSDNESARFCMVSLTVGYAD